MQMAEDSALAGNPAAVHRWQPQTGEQTRNKQTRGQWPQEHLVGEPELRLSLSSCPHRRHQRTECAIKVTLELSPAGEWMDSDRFPKQLVNCEADLRAILHP
jgi:hypothetical protein